ncbi:MAG TPA: lmo0937 family membrane protein [Kofleriaceae bacterium]|nr:lmo0937 family membrane protein [Kofleriaceae bacterium]
MVVAVVLVVMWGLGMATSFTMGGVIHVLLVVAIIAVLARVIMGRRAV